jgi:hypothetical protein
MPLDGVLFMMITYNAIEFKFNSYQSKYEANISAFGT